MSVSLGVGVCGGGGGGGGGRCDHDASSWLPSASLMSVLVIFGCEDATHVLTDVSRLYALSRVHLPPLDWGAGVL